MNSQRAVIILLYRTCWAYLTRFKTRTVGRTGWIHYEETRCEVGHLVLLGLYKHKPWRWQSSNSTRTTRGKPNTSDFVNPRVPIKHLPSTDSEKEKNVNTTKVEFDQIDNDKSLTPELVLKIDSLNGGFGTCDLSHNVTRYTIFNDFREIRGATERNTSNTRRFNYWTRQTCTESFSCNFVKSIIIIVRETPWTLSGKNMICTDTKRIELYIVLLVPIFQYFVGKNRP